MQELVDYADVRRVLPVTRIRLRAMDLQELLTYMTNGSIEFRWHSTISNASWSSATKISSALRELRAHWRWGYLR
jgi:hypothetical protein